MVGHCICLMVGHCTCLITGHCICLITGQCICLDKNNNELFLVLHVINVCSQYIMLKSTPFLIWLCVFRNNCIWSTIQVEIYIVKFLCMCETGCRSKFIRDKSVYKFVIHSYIIIYNVPTCIPNFQQFWYQRISSIESSP